MNEQAINTKLRNFCTSYDGSYYQKLNDPVQTHAVYGIPKSDKEMVKLTLRSLGAKKFRTVQPHAKNLTIICFDASGMA